MIEAIRHYISNNPAACMLVVGVIGTAFASTFPENRPKTLDDWWNWARDFVHQVGNARHPTQPEGPAKE